MPPRDTPTRLACPECGTALAENAERCANCGAAILDHPLDHGRGSGQGAAAPADDRLLFEDRTPNWVYWTLLAVGFVAVLVTYMFWRSDVSGFLTFGFLVEFLLYLVVVGFCLLRLSRKNEWRTRSRVWYQRNVAAMANLGKATTSGFARAGKGFTTGFSAEKPNFVVRFIFWWIRLGVRLYRFGFWVYRKVERLVLFVWRLARAILRLAYRIVRWALRVSWRVVYWVLRWWPIRYATRFAEPYVRPKIEPILLKLDVDISRLLLLPVPPERMARYEELGLARRRREREEEAEIEAEARDEAEREVAAEAAADERKTKRRLGLPFGKRRGAAAEAESEKMAVTDEDAPHRPGNVIEIEGVGPAYAAKLEALGVRSTNDLLARDPVQLANELNEPEAMVRKWHAMADLMRLDGVGKQYAEVLARIGVGSIEDLSKRNAKELADAATRDQEQTGVTIQKNPITEKRVKGWVKEAAAWLKNDAKERAKAAKVAEKEEARRKKEAQKAAKAEAKAAKKSGGSAKPIEK